MKKTDNSHTPFTVNGIVAEYNPFHNGHHHQLRDALSHTGADYTVVIMSGNFMQRGTPALLDKYKRTEMALRCGADLVLELPALYSASSAEYFATGAVALLDKLGVVNHLCFGSECNNLEVLQKIADILCEEPEGYVTLLKQNLKHGYSYPTARTMALVQFQPELSGSRDVLSFPNNILGIEYLKALRRRDCSIKAHTTLRNSNHHSRMPEEQFSSSLALRQAILDHRDPSMLASQIPEDAYRILEAALASESPLQLDDLSAQLLYKLATEADMGYSSYLDVSSDLSDRIRNRLYEYTSFSGFCDLLKTKDMTYTRISRCLMHILLDIRNTDMELYRQADYIKYARVLGFRRDAEALLTAIKQNSTIPLLTKLADAKEILDRQGLFMLHKELRINAVYESAAAIKSGRPMNNEYRSPLVIIS